MAVVSCTLWLSQWWALARSRGRWAGPVRGKGNGVAVQYSIAFASSLLCVVALIIACGAVPSDAEGTFKKPVEPDAKNILMAHSRILVYCMPKSLYRPMVAVAVMPARPYRTLMHPFPARGKKPHPTGGTPDGNQGSAGRL